jgi:hypothetical protein
MCEVAWRIAGLLPVSVSTTTRKVFPLLLFSQGRSALRVTAVGGALIGAFAFASPANAALGGATPSNFTSSPNLVSVTANQAEETVVYKFDRAVSAGSGGLDVTDFRLGGYDPLSLTNFPASVSIVGTGDSVLADFGGTDVDFNSLTYAALNAGTVKGTITNSKDNFQDATRITGATTESGTTGHTDGPDLVSASRNEDLEQITYTFDQAVDDDAVTPAFDAFGFVDVNGNETQATSLVNVSGNRVIVQFGVDVSDATKATLDEDEAGTASSITADGYVTAPVTGAYYDAVAISGTPVPATPNLLSASIDTNGVSVTYVFDKTVTVGAPGDFHVFLANGDIAGGTATQLLADAKSVRVTFGLENRNEFAVFANINDGAVTGATNSIPSSTDGAPIGGNAGAQASGYTTAPDAIQALVNPAAGQASVLYDSRFSSAVPANPAVFTLYTADGVSLGNPSAASATFAAAPQQSRVVLTLTDTQATNAKNVVINGFPFLGVIPVLGSIQAGPSGFPVGSSLPLQATTGTFKK